MRTLFLLPLLFCVSLSHTIAQDLGNSPYSQAGIGDLRTPATAAQQAMPGANASFTMPFFVNTVNPALLGRISKTKTTIFEGGMLTQYKHLQQGNASQKDFGGSLDYLKLAFPLSNRMGGCIGLSPYSSANSQNTISQAIVNSNFLSDITYQREGGINNAFFATGYDFASILNVDSLKNRFMLGLKVNYTFGSVIDQTIISMFEGSNQSASFQANRYRRTSYSDITFETGFTYTRRIGRDRNLHIGGVTAIGNNVNAKRFESLDLEVIGNSNVKLDSDTLSDNLAGKVYLPQKFTLGFTYEKEYKWAISAEASWQNWNSFSTFGESSSLGQSLVIGVGGQLMPDFFSVAKGFWRRSVFRAGVQWERTPVQIKGKSIEDISLRIGTSIPFGRTGGILTLGVAGGRRGTLGENLVRETYFRLNLGITINDRWFMKPKFD